MLKHCSLGTILRSGLKFNSYIQIVVIIFLLTGAYLFVFKEVQLSGDDLWFLNIDLENLSEYLNTRWQGWSSRLGLELVLFFCLHNFFLFRIILFLIVLSTPLLVLKFFRISYNLENYLVFALTLFLFDYHILSTAGWVTTITHYLFPFYAFITAKILIDSKNTLKIFLSAPILAYACNQELVALLSLAFFFFQFFQKKYIRQEDQLIYVSVLPIIVTLLMLFLTLYCPGNIHRVQLETQTWFPVWDNFSYFYKFYLGYISTAYYYICIANVVLPFLLSTAMFICTRRLDATLSVFVIVFLLLLMLGIFNDTFSLNYQNFYFNKSYLDFSKVLGLVFLVLIGIYVCLIMRSGLLLIDKFAILFFIATAFFVRIAMGFSPTVFASSTRTFFVTDMVCLFVSSYLLFKYSDSTKKNCKYLLGTACLSQCYLYLL